MQVINFQLGIQSHLLTPGLRSSPHIRPALPIKIHLQIQLGDIVQARRLLKLLTRALPRARDLDLRAAANINNGPGIGGGSGNPRAQAVVDVRVELLLAGAQGGAHDLLEAGGAQLGAQRVARRPRALRPHQPVHQVQVPRDVVRRVPLHAADVRRGRVRRSGLRVEPREVRLRAQRFWCWLLGAAWDGCGLGRVGGRVRFSDRGSQLCLSVRLRGKGYYVQLMQEDPEDFLRDIDNFAVPYRVRARLVHVFDPGEWFFSCFWRRVLEISKNFLSTLRQSVDIFCCSIEMHKQKIDNDTARREL